MVEAVRSNRQKPGIGSLNLREVSARPGYFLPHRRRTDFQSVSSLRAEKRRIGNPSYERGAAHFAASPASPPPRRIVRRAAVGGERVASTLYSSPLPSLPAAVRRSASSRQVSGRLDGAVVGGVASTSASADAASPTFARSPTTPSLARRGPCRRSASAAPAADPASRSVPELHHDGQPRSARRLRHAAELLRRAGLDRQQCLCCGSARLLVSVSSWPAVRRPPSAGDLQLAHDEALALPSVSCRRASRPTPWRSSCVACRPSLRRCALRLRRAQISLAVVALARLDEQTDELVDEVVLAAVEDGTQRLLGRRLVHVLGPLAAVGHDERGDEVGEIFFESLMIGLRS